MVACISHLHRCISLHQQTSTCYTEELQNLSLTASWTFDVELSTVINTDMQKHTHVCVLIIQLHRYFYSSKIEQMMHRSTHVLFYCKWILRNALEMYNARFTMCLKHLHLTLNHSDLELIEI